MARPKKVKKVQEEVAPEEEVTPEPESEERLTPPEEPVEEYKEESLPPGDYLRKYQYRKNTVPGSMDSDPPRGSKAEKMKDYLLSQERVRVMIPREKGEDPKSTLSVTLNGYRLDLPKNVYVQVPLQVAEILAESLEQTDAAILKGQIGADRRKENALL